MATRRTTRDSARSSGRPGASADEAFRYIESSAILAALLEQEPSAQRAISLGGRRMTSALTFSEAERGLVRARVAGRLPPETERAALRWLREFRRVCDVASVTDPVLARAGKPYPVEPIRTLDAIHLATAESLGLPPQLITIVTRDARVRDNAVALGYQVE